LTAIIRETNVFTDTFLALLGKLSSISDPSGKSKWIYSAFPEKTIDKPSDYPLIVITPTDVSYDPLTFKNLKRGPLRLSIDIYSTKARELDDISDQILNKLESEEENLLTSGISVMRLIGTSYGQFPRGDFRIHNKTLNYEFDFGWY